MSDEDERVRDEDEWVSDDDDEWVSGWVRDEDE